MLHLGAASLVISIRRIQKHRQGSRVHGLKRPGPAIRVGESNLRAVFIPQGGDVAVDQGDEIAVSLDEDRSLRASAQGLESDGPRAREEVDNHPTLHQLAHDVEERFANPVACRLHVDRKFRSVDLVAPALPGDDSHGVTPSLRSRQHAGHLPCSRRQRFSSNHRQHGPKFATPGHGTAGGRHVEQHAILDRKTRRLLFRVLPGQTAIDEVRGAGDVIGIA